MTEPGGFAVAVFGAETTRRCLTKNVLIGPVLQPAQKRVVEHGLEILQIVVGRFDGRIVAAQPLAIDENFPRRIPCKPPEMSNRGIAVLAIDRMIMVLRPCRDFMFEIDVKPAMPQIRKIE